MTEYSCNFCENKFNSKYTLDKHKKTAKFCLEIQNKNLETIYTCNDCNKTFSRKDTYENHIIKCKIKISKLQNVEFQRLKELNILLEKEIELLRFSEKKFIDERIKYEKLEIKYEILENEYKKLVEMNSQSMEKLASKAIENAGHKTYNNQTINRNQILNNLLPLTNDYMKEQTQYFGVNYIKHGPQSLAKFASDYTFKDRIAITDASRKKFVFKDENGNLINDFNGIKITDKFLETNKEVIEQSCNEYLAILDYKLSFYKAREDIESTSFYENELFKTKHLLKTISNKDSPDNIKNMEIVKNEFIINLIKIFETMENEKHENSI